LAVWQKVQMNRHGRPTDDITPLPNGPGRRIVYFKCNALGIAERNHSRLDSFNTTLLKPS
jgi:hypothetical protein